MSPRRRQLTLRVLFEIRGTFPDNMQTLLSYSNADLAKLIETIEKRLEEARSTDPAPPIR